jgi:hypothetical protein
MDHDVIDDGTGISRRTALRGIAVGAGAAWAAPTVLSMASVADAGSAAPCHGVICGPLNVPICGSGPDGDICVQASDPAGECNCGFPNGGGVCTPCSSNADCATHGADWVCLSWDCCDSTACVPPCPNPGDQATDTQIRTATAVNNRPSVS